MSGTLALTALVMGLAGGPHCAAMCGPACTGVIRIVRAGKVSSGGPLWQFHIGRLLGYSLAGAAAAFAVQSLAWLTAQTSALRPVWTLFHVAVLAWGLVLMAAARQPLWVSRAGRTAWSYMRPLAGSERGAFVAGSLWAFMPCGLLYSALLVASLAGGPLDGALSMALFAGGSAVSLALVPVLLKRLRQGRERSGRDWGTRASGLLLVLAAAWSLWIDVVHRIAAWCGLA